MRNYLRFFSAILILCAGTIFVTAQEISRNSSTASQNVFVGDDKTDKDKNAAEEIKDPLIKILLSKDLITLAEAQALAAGGSSAGQRDALATLLLSKGIISAAELDTIRPVNPPAPTTVNASLKTVSTVNKTTAASAAATGNSQTAPAVIPAIAPLRVLQLEGAKRDGLIPDIKLGSGAKIKLYGFFKTGVVYDSSSPGGNDFPLPGFLGDTGPNASPEFHIKVRAFRLGANFEWLDPAPNLTLTGRLEFDFEGDFTRVNNRNISSIRSSQPSIRLAWVRIDKVFDEKTSGHILFGQDWTPFGSSTVPNTIETTGFHLGYGNIYERAPQIRTGINFLLTKKRSVRLQPEIAFVLPFFGNTPTDVGNQLGFGERQGADSQRPEVQGRVVLQFQLDKAPGVVPAQLIASFTQGRRKAILRRSDIPAAFVAAFPNGAEVESNRYGYSAEFQLPTRYFTLIGKYYRGADLRAYFGGQLFSTYNDISGLTNVVTGTSIDGSSTVAFGLRNGQPVIADQNPVRGQGGFINLGIPLSRLFDADPKGRMAGFTAYLHYGYDEAFARDVRQILGATLNPIGAPANQFGANRGKSDVAFASLQYKLNAIVTFAFEQSYFRTRAANNAGFLPLFRGIPTRETHNNRSEFATIFSF